MTVARRVMGGLLALAFVLAAGCEEDECFSPTQHAATAYQDGAQGCACDAKRDQPVCVSGAALQCEGDRWIAVQDGACHPQQMPDGGGADAALGCFSPTQNTAHAYDPGAMGCACEPGKDKAVCVSGAALICQVHRWVAVEDGPCEPRPTDDAGSDDAGADDAGR